MKDTSHKSYEDYYKKVEPYNPYVDIDIASAYALTNRLKDIVRLRTPDKVIFNNPATIVIWSDGSKTVVKCHNEDFDPEKGLAMAICKKVLGGAYHKIFKTYLPNDENEQCKQSRDGIEFDSYRYWSKQAENVAKELYAKLIKELLKQRDDHA